MSTLTESALDSASAVYDFTLPAGDPWIDVIKRGQTFRIVDVEGDQAADTLFFNARDPVDRYSAQDTIREQGGLYLTTGTKLLSTRGHVLLTITADTCGRHDTLGGACACGREQYGALRSTSASACLPRQLSAGAADGPRQARPHP